MTWFALRVLLCFRYKMDQRTNNKWCLSLSTLGAKWCGGPTSALCVSGDFSLASCSVPPVTAFSSAPAEVLQVRQNEPEHSEQGASGNCFKKCSVQLNSSANMDIRKQSLASTEGLIWCQPGHWESGGTNSLHTCWRMAGAPRVSIDWYFPCCGTRMQKSTLHFRACGTIQAVTALDAEVREALFPTSTARCYKNVLYRTALRAGPEAIPAPACLPPVANSNSIVQPVALEARDSCTS